MGDSYEETFNAFLRQHEGKSTQQLIAQALAMLLESSLSAFNILSASLVTELIRRYLSSRADWLNEFDADERAEIEAARARVADEACGVDLRDHIIARLATLLDRGDR